VSLWRSFTPPLVASVELGQNRNRDQECHQGQDAYRRFAVMNEDETNDKQHKPHGKTDVGIPE
jgi:hypothetical protein